MNFDQETDALELHPPESMEENISIRENITPNQMEREVKVR